MVWEAIAGNLAGSAIGGAFNAREASKNRQFQERMSRTQYQRAAADMEKAGLNRVLALGSPASSPSGAQGAMEAPQPGTTGIAAASAKQAIAQGKAQEELLKAQKIETEQKTRLTAAEAAKAEVQKGAYEALGPAAEKLFQTLGSGATNAVNNSNIAETVSEAVQSGARRIWNNSPASKLWNAAKEKFEATRDYWRRR